MQHCRALLPLEDLVANVWNATYLESIHIEDHSKAPLWLRLLFGTTYFAYKNTVYVPTIHFTLTKSKSSHDRDVAIAKLLPWLAALYDDVLSSPWKLATFLLHKKAIFYFCYEFLYLKLAESPLTKSIVDGFCLSRHYLFSTRSGNYHKTFSTLLAILERGTN